MKIRFHSREILIQYCTNVYCYQLFWQFTIHRTYITSGNAHNKLQNYVVHCPQSEVHLTYIMEVCSNALYQVNDCNYTDQIMMN
jgi:hypothetical protein